jgi:hypothetical protein
MLYQKRTMSGRVRTMFLSVFFLFSFLNNHDLQFSLKMKVFRLKFTKDLKLG